MMKAAKAENWEWDGKEIALMLKNGFDEQKPVIATSAAGCIPYWSDLPVIDTIGLNDYYIPRYSKRNIQDRRIGYGFGDGYYILSRKPDIIIFCGPWGSMGPCFTSEVQIYETQEFKDNYIPTLFKIDKGNKRISSIMWINKKSLNIGIKRINNVIKIPAYFLGNYTRNPVYFKENERKFILRFSFQESYVFLPIDLENGYYTITIEPNMTGYVEIKDTKSDNVFYVEYGKKFFLNYSRYEIKLKVVDINTEISKVIIKQIGKDK